MTRCNYVLRTVPPSLAQEYARSHDDSIQHVLRGLLDLEDGTTPPHFEQVSSLPHCLGGAGLRSAVRTSPAAYWASWADAVPMLRARTPTLAEFVAQRLVRDGNEQSECLSEVNACRRLLASEGFAGPDWAAIWSGTRPEQVVEPEPGEWRHGWQYFAASQRERFFRDSALFPSLSEPRQALLRSQSGCCSGRHLSLLPVSPETTYTPERFRAILQRRLRVPLAITARTCNGASCQRELDPYGDHRAACAVAGRLVRRAGPAERMWARVCREGGARVQPNMYLRDMNLDGIAADDGRRLEVVANGLPLYHGKQLAIDATIVSPLRADGAARARAASVDGVAIADAIRDKRNTYRELLRSRRCHMLVAPVEVGGRWGGEAYKFLIEMAKARARRSPAALRRSLAQALVRRWSGMIAFAVHDALAATLLEDTPRGTDGLDGEEPPRGILLQEA